MSQSYVVLARKYRPQRLTELVGQESLVKTLQKCIQNNTIPHAFLLHGIRGVGKTTTARILAKALNCESPIDGFDPCGKCASCKAVDKESHLDVIEMDAASRTSVDDIREIIDGAHYKAVMGRYKIYIIDEVHMLSKSAFNAFLKTLEEPPLHVKFIFATTELHKIPETILSRCMRFDLKRIPDDALKNHLITVCDKEKVSYDDPGLQVIVRCAGGSVRDALSLMNQAIAMHGNVTYEGLKDLLGLADVMALWDLLIFLCKGDPEKTLKAQREMVEKGADPLLVLEDLLDLIYRLACLKSSPSLIHDAQWLKDEKKKAQEFVEIHSMGVLMRLWQVLLKGYDDVKLSPLPKPTVEMLLLQLCYMSSIPTPSELLNNPKSGSLPTGKSAFSTPSLIHESSHKNAPPTELKKNTVPLPHSLIDIVQALTQSKELILLSHLEHDAHFVSLEQKTLLLHIKESAPSDFKKKLETVLSHYYGDTFYIKNVSENPKTLTLAEKRAQEKKEKEEKALNSPVVKQLKEMLDVSNIEVIH